MIDATNRGDTEAFIASFTDDAYLVDWGREFHGHEGVARWNETDNIGKQSHFEVRGARRNGDEHVVTLEVTGNGYNGTGDIVSRSKAIGSNV
jgi:ketosteroid isomerase-like protein